MTFGRGPLLPQNIIFVKNVGKNYQSAFKVNDMKRERFNMFRKLVFHGTMNLLDREGK